MALRSTEELRALVTAWRAEAARRRGLSPIDPPADTLEWCARELDTALTRLVRQPVALKVHEFAAQLSRETGREIRPPTVRRWIRQGALPAHRQGRDYLIPADARPLAQAA